MVGRSCYPLLAIPFWDLLLFESVGLVLGLLHVHLGLMGIYCTSVVLFSATENVRNEYQEMVESLQ